MSDGAREENKEHGVLIEELIHSFYRYLIESHCYKKWDMMVNKTTTTKG